MKITKSKLAQIVQEELSNAMSEAEQWKMGRSMKAADLAAERGIADAQEDFARIQAGGKVLQIDTTEETQEEEDAYNKGWQNEMDRLQQSAANRKLNRPPPPETPEDIEAAQAEYDFESHFSEGKMKITKSKLARIIQEELAAIKAEGYKAYKRDELGDENERIYPKRTLSRHAKELAKNRKKGYSPQAAVTAVPDNEEGEKRLHKSGLGPHSDKKPKRGLEEAGEGMDTLEAHMLGRLHALEVSQGEREDSDIMMMGNEAYRAGFEDATEEIAAEQGDDSLHRDPAHDYEDDSYEEVEDDDWMWENKITKSKLAQIIQEELKATLSEDLAPYGNLKGYVLQTLRVLGGEQPVSDIAHVAGEAWAADNWSDDDLIDEEDMFYSVKAALESLQVDKRVRLTQGGPDSSDEDFYALAQ